MAGRRVGFSSGEWGLKNQRNQMDHRQFSFIIPAFVFSLPCIVNTNRQAELGLVSPKCNSTQEVMQRDHSRTSCAHSNYSFIGKHCFFRAILRGRGVGNSILCLGFFRRKKMSCKWTDFSCPPTVNNPAFNHCPANHLMRRGNGRFCLVSRCL